jgi:hypothetical protein
MEGWVPKMSVCGCVADETCAPKDSVRRGARGTSAAVVVAATAATAVVKEATLLGSFLGVVRAFLGEGVTR